MRMYVYPDGLSHICIDRFSYGDTHSQGKQRFRSHRLFLGLGFDWGSCVHTAKSCGGQARELRSGARQKLGYVNDEALGCAAG